MPNAKSPADQARTVAIVGASRDRTKYGNRSLRAHRQQGWTVFPVNPHVDEVEGLRTYPTLGDVPVPRLNRISMYVPPSVGMQILGQIAAKEADEIWFNPGSADEALIAKAESLGLNVIEACSILDVGMSPSELSP